MKDIVKFMNDQDLGDLSKGFQNSEKSPVMATPAAAIAAVLGWKVVGAAAAGVTGVGAAYVTGRVVN